MWLTFILFQSGRKVAILSMGMPKLLNLKSRSKLYATEDELKILLRIKIEVKAQDEMESTLLVVLGMEIYRYGILNRDGKAGQLYMLLQDTQMTSFISSVQVMVNFHCQEPWTVY